MGGVTGGLTFLTGAPGGTARQYRRHGPSGEQGWISVGHSIGAPTKRDAGTVAPLAKVKPATRVTERCRAVVSESSGNTWGCPELNVVAHCGCSARSRA